MKTRGSVPSTSPSSSGRADRGQAADIRIEAQEIMKIRKRLNEMIARETGQPYEKVHEDSDRNFWMNAEEAVEYGVISRVVTSADDIGKK